MLSFLASVGRKASVGGVHRLAQDYRTEAGGGMMNEYKVYILFRLIKITRSMKYLGAVTKQFTFTIYFAGAPIFRRISETR